MEILVATLVYTRRDVDVMTQIRSIAETLRNAPGLVTSRVYHGRGQETCYFLLTTWADEESWQSAQERHNPQALLLALADLLVAPPEQWIMYYLWGYTRPTAPPVLAAVHIMTIRSDQIEGAQRGWIMALKQQAAHPTLAFAFLARDISTAEAIDPQRTDKLRNGDLEGKHPRGGNSLLSLFSWAREAEREEFYTDPHYRAIKRFVESVGVVRTLPLEPL